MCGIIGKLSNVDFDIDAGTKLLNHRGPDAMMTKSFKIGNNYIKLGHTRLSIIDLDDRSNQPFNYLNKYFLIFNGEIYNYKNIKSQLSEFQFKTESDTEVLLYWLIKYKGENLNCLNGIFSFCFLNLETEEIILGRDQLGIKPLYFLNNDKEFVFSSEIKALKKISNTKTSIDKDAIPEFLQLGFIMEPNTGFHEIKKVPPGSILKYCFNSNEIEIEEYWNPLHEVKSKRSEENFDELIRKSIKDQLISDVSIGTFFSGGVDSSIIAINARNDTTFLTSVNDHSELKKAGIDDDYFYANKISSMLNLDLVKLKQNDEEASFINKIKLVVDLNEELISDFTSYPTYLLSKKAKEYGLSVILSGMGADEIFGGYPRYVFMYYLRLIKKIAPFIHLFKSHSFIQKKIERIEGFVSSKDDLESYLNLLTPFSQKNIKNLTGKNLSNPTFKNRFNKIWGKYHHLGPVKASMCFDIYGFLSHNFILADKASMRASVEMRVPLATKELLNFSLNTKNSDLIYWGRSKYLLKKYLLNFIPRKLVFRRKTGFHPPVDSKILEIGQVELLMFFKNSKLLDYLNFSEVKVIIDNHFKNKINNTFKIYRLLYLALWLESNEL